MPKIIENTFSNASVRLSYQRKVFRRNGKFYLFWADKISDERKLIYRLADSIAGLITAESKEATSGENSGRQYGNYYDVHYDRHHDRVGIAWVKYPDADHRQLYFKFGTFNADGSLNWSGEHKVESETFEEFRDPTLNRSGSGKWGIFLKRYDGQTYEACFYSCNSTTPTSTANWQYQGNLPPGNLHDAYRSHRIGRLGNSGDDLLMVYKVGESLAAKRWDGSSVGVEKLVAVEMEKQEISPPVTDSQGNIHLVCFDDKSNSNMIKHVVYKAAEDEWDSTIEEIPSPAGKHVQNLTLQIDAEDNLHVFFKNSSAQRMHYFKRANGAWSDETVNLTGDLAEAYDDLRETPTGADYDDSHVLIAWVNEVEDDDDDGHKKGNGNDDDPGHNNDGEEANELWMDGVPLPVPVVAPIADFEAVPTSGNAPLTVNFTDQSTPGTDPITSWEWDFGDGNTSNEQNPTHTYNTPGTYDVELKVTAGNLSDTIVKSSLVSVTEVVGPTADFEANPTSGNAPLTVNFSDQSTPGTNPISSWEWDFGDGNTSNEQNPTHTYNTPGTYDVELKVTAGNLSDTIVKSSLISVVEVVGPTADFEANPTSGNAPLTVNFTDQSTPGTNPISSWEWDFGDGNSSNEQNPAHTYNTPGTYDVELKVTAGNLSDTEVKSSFISVVEVVGPTADFEANPTSGNAPLTVNFTDQSSPGTNPISSWEWDFGDGGSSNQQNPAHTYNTPGTYAVKLTVSDGTLSDTEVKSSFISVTEVVGPTADFQANPTSGNAPLTANFTDQSTPGTNPITSWEWDFGDGGSSNQQNPAHTYNTPGTYAVKLTVSDGTLSDTKVKSSLISVSEVVGPTADFQANPTSGNAPLMVNFSDQSTPGTNPISSWQWDFGDGGSSNQQNPTHTYNTPGTYAVKLTVSDGTLSDTKVKSSFITVTEVPLGPDANFTGVPVRGEAPLEVHFSDQSTPGTNPITSRQWNFGDGQSSTQQNPVHTYGTPGNYTVGLTVSDGTMQDTATKTNFIRVLEAIDECKSERFKCVLCYFVLWVLGLFFFLYDKNKCVRFHGLQSTITFLLLTVVGIILFELQSLLLFYILIFLTVILWLLLMFKAWSGLRYKLPIIGNIAEKVVYK